MPRQRCRGICSSASRPLVEYSPLYHPFNWRGWVDWGQGALGDMGAHLIDFPVWALDLDLPTAVETTSTPFNGLTFRWRRRRTTTSRAKGRRPVGLTWYDGGFLPPTPEELTGERDSPAPAASSTSGPRASCSATRACRRASFRQPHNSTGARGEARTRAARGTR